MGLLRGARDSAGVLCSAGYAYAGEGWGVAGGFEYSAEFDFDLAFGYGWVGVIDSYLRDFEPVHFESVIG